MQPGIDALNEVTAWPGAQPAHPLMPASQRMAAELPGGPSARLRMPSALARGLDADPDGLACAAPAWLQRANGGQARDGQQILGPLQDL